MVKLLLTALISITCFASYISVRSSSSASGGSSTPSIVDNGNSGSTKTIDLSTGEVQSLTITANTTLSLTNPTAGGTYLLTLYQDSTGNRSITWPSEVRWANGNDILSTSAASRLDLVTLFYNGTHYIASYTPNTNVSTAYEPTKSLVLNGSNQYVNFGDNLDIERTDTFSISMWVKFASLSSAQSLFAKQDTNSPYRGPIYEVASSSSVVFQLNNTDGSNAIDRRFNSVSLSTNTWYHFVLTYSGSSTATGVKLYINGVEQSGTTTTNNLNATTINAINANLGGYGNGSALGFNGKMTEVSFWSTELSQANVTTLYNSGSPTDLSITAISGNTHWYKMADNVNDSVGVLNGTAVNSPTYSTDVP